MPRNILNLVDSFFDDYNNGSLPVLRMPIASTSPALNIKESDDDYSITLTIPGLDPKEVKVTLTDNVLSFSYDHKEETSTDSKSSVLRQEYKHYSFSRTVSLPKNIDINSLKAQSKNGILTVTIHKLPESKPKSIDIEITE